MTYIPQDDPMLLQAIRVIESTYSDTVSVEQKGKNLEKSAAFVEGELQIRQSGGVFRQVETIGSTGGASVAKFNPYIIAPKNSDIRLMATAGGAGTDVSGSIQGYLAIVV